MLCLGETSGFEMPYERRASIPMKRVREAFESDIESDESGFSWFFRYIQNEKRPETESISA